ERRRRSGRGGWCADPRKPAATPRLELEVSEGVLRRGFALAAIAALEYFAGQVATAETEGQGKRQDETAEQDAEGDEDHVATDADLNERRGDGEEQHDPASGARQEPRLEQARIDGGD